MKLGYDHQELIHDFADLNGFEVIEFGDLPKSAVTECYELGDNKRAFYLDLERWGLLQKSKPRWNDDGSWNY